jgi:hypothetical protein
VLVSCSAPSFVCQFRGLLRPGTANIAYAVYYRYTYIRGPFEKFVDSPYYSESELCEGAVTVPFSKYLPWQAMHLLKRSTHFSKTCCRPLITSKFLASELPFHGWKNPEISWGERCELNFVFGLEKVDGGNPIRTSAIQSRSRPMRFLGFSNHEKRAPKKKFRNDQRSAARF